MDSALTLGKKSRRKAALCAVILWLPFIFAGCTFNAFPDESNARWVSDDPVMILEYKSPPAVKSFEAKEYLEVDGERMYFSVGYMVNSFTAFPVNVSTITADNELLKGTYRLKRDSLVFTVEKDKVFGGKYKEIHFTREELWDEPITDPDYSRRLAWTIVTDAMADFFDTIFDLWPW